MCSEPPHSTHHPPTSTPTLPLSWLPVLEPPWMPTPPRLTLVSVPFLWEEAPGKPRRPSAASKVLWQVPVVAAGKLPPPPRLLKNEVVKQSNNLASPTRVVEGDDQRGGVVVGSKRWGSFRMCDSNGSGRFRRGRSASSSSLSLSSYATSHFLVIISKYFQLIIL